MESAIKIFSNFPGYTIVNDHGVGHKSLIGVVNDYLFLFPSKGSAIWDICAGHCIAKEYGGGYYTTKGEEYPYDPEHPFRELTPRECLNLTGFPKEFKMVVPKTEVYHQAGNSIVVNVIEALYKQMDITNFAK